MRTIISIISLLACALPSAAQGTLSLDSCRSMALRNNKQLSVTRLQQDAAKQLRKAARTKYLPHLDVAGGYVYTSREISILNNTQKSTLNNIGTTVGGMLQLNDERMAAALNALGKDVTDAFRTDTRNMFMVSAIVTQPLYMGGAITAANKIADINETMAGNAIEAATQTTLSTIDDTYWTVVSLRHKQKLAQQYLDLVQKLHGDVQKMIDEGVATRADGLKVNVKVNEAEMQVTQVEDGLALAKMLLCQLCGMPTDSQVTLTDEQTDEVLLTDDVVVADRAAAINDRAEVRMLQNAVDISKQTTKLVRAAYLPQLLLTGGYIATNPNVYDGYTEKFAGVWNVGLMLRIPVWNWFEGTYKVRAAKAATSIATMEMNDAKEKIELQVQQQSFKVDEAYKKLSMAKKNVEKADENLRCANIGFREGVLQSTDVMEAQTAWMQAKSQKIDAEVGVKLAQAGLRKALGMVN